MALYSYFNAINPAFFCRFQQVFSLSFFWFLGGFFLRARRCSQSARPFESREDGRRKVPGELRRSFFCPCLICCKAAPEEVAAHPASGDRRNVVLTLAAGNALKEGNVSTEQLLGDSADYTGAIVKPVIHA